MQLGYRTTTIGFYRTNSNKTVGSGEAVKRILWGMGYGETDI
jgi:hypothetical protein